MRATIRSVSRPRAAPLALCLVGLLVLALTVGCDKECGEPGAPSENGIQPEVVSVEYDCSDRDGDLMQLALEPSPPQSGVYTFPDGVNTITLNSDGTYFGWLSTLGVDCVIARGEESANRYLYAADQDAPEQEWFQDNLLHPPLDDDDGGEPYDIAEILVCYDLEKEDIGRIVVAKESTQPEIGDSFDFQASGTLGSFILEPGETRVFNGLPADATYSFTETVPTGWSLADLECVETGEAETEVELAASEEWQTTVSLDDGEEIVCTFTNKPETGQLMVVKKLVPVDDPGLFDLIIDGEVEKADASHGDATAMLEVVVGEHTVGEAAGTDTDLENYDVAYRCVKTATLEKTQFANGSIEELNTLFVDPGDVITCTITNTRKTGDVVIEKETDVGTKTKFQFASSVDPSSFSLGSGESKTFEDLPVGDTATFTETVPDGWELSSIDCTSDPRSLQAVLNPSTGVDPVADEVIACTFANVAVPFITVDKTADPKIVPEPGGKVKYTVKVTSLGTTGPVKLTDLRDDIYGVLTDSMNPKITKSTCELDVYIEAATPYQCSFTAMVKGKAGTSLTDVVKATVHDGQKDIAEASDPATVKIVTEIPDTGVGMPVTSAVGLLAAAGFALTAAGAALRRRTAKRS